MTEKYTTKDSGSREECFTGAVRDVREGKGRFDLISPWAEARLAGVYERGAAKYGDRNWEKGLNISRFIDSAKRHINQYLKGMTDEDHLAQAAWNIVGAIHVEEMMKRGVLPKELDDLPRYEPKDELPGIDVPQCAIAGCGRSAVHWQGGKPDSARCDCHSQIK